MKFNTKCVHGSGKPDSTGAISPAIYMSSTFSLIRRATAWNN